MPALAFELACLHRCACLVGEVPGHAGGIQAVGRPVRQPRRAAAASVQGIAAAHPLRLEKDRARACHQSAERVLEGKIRADDRTTARWRPDARGSWRPLQARSALPAHFSPTSNSLLTRPASRCPSTSHKRHKRPLQNSCKRRPSLSPGAPRHLAPQCTASELASRCAQAESAAPPPPPPVAPPLAGAAGCLLLAAALARVPSACPHPTRSSQPACSNGRPRAYQACHQGRTGRHRQAGE